MLSVPSNTLRIYVPETNAIRETQNIQWMKKMYYQEDKSLSDMTIDSLELLIQNGKVRKLKVIGQMHNAKSIAMPFTIAQQETDKPIENPKRSPRVVTFKKKRKNKQNQSMSLVWTKPMTGVKKWLLSFYQKKMMMTVSLD